MTLACPNCAFAVEVGPGQQVGCPRCGALVGQLPLAREVPDARSFTERVEPTAVRFVSRGALVLPIVLGLVGLLLIGCSFLALDAGAPPVAYVIMPLLPAFFLAIALLSLVHYSEVTIDRSAVTIRSFPLPGDSSGRYPRELVGDPAWVKTPGTRGGYSYGVRLALLDGRTLHVPLEVVGEGQCAYVVDRLRAALAR